MVIRNQIPAVLC